MSGKHPPAAGPARRRALMGAGQVPLIVGTVAVLLAVSVAAWRLHLRSLEHEAAERRLALKRLTISGDIPPTEDVVSYLQSRHSSLERSFHHWLDWMSVPPVAAAPGVDAQVLYQERVHDVQRSLERLAAARTLKPPELLGLPKELPPAETVPRLLTQLQLIQDCAELILKQDGVTLISFKVDDPEAVALPESTVVLMTRLPVRVRLAAPLPPVMAILDALGKSKPLIDVRAFQVVTDGSPPQSGSPAPLDVEALVARYLIDPAAAEIKAPGP
jgi:hypothetical protein